MLAGAPTALELPADRPRPPVASLRGAWLRTTVAAARSARGASAHFAQAHGLTLFMVLLGGFEVLLHRYSRQTDLLVGTPVDTRSRSELEAVIGPFVNTLVLRSDLSNPTRASRALLGRVPATKRSMRLSIRSCRSSGSSKRSPPTATSAATQSSRPRSPSTHPSRRSSLPASRRRSWRRRRRPRGSTSRSCSSPSRADSTPSGSTASDLFDEDTIAQMARHFVASCARS